MFTITSSRAVGLLSGLALLWAAASRGEDDDPVLLRCPSNVSVNLTSVKAQAAATWGPPEISGDNSSDYNFTSDHSSGDWFPVGDTVVHYTAANASGNNATCEFVVSVIDLRVLEFIQCPTDITKIPQSGQSRAVVTWQEPIILEGRDTSVTANHRPGELFDLGRTAVSYTASDTMGNFANCNFTVIVTGFPYNHFKLTRDYFLPGRDDRILLHSNVEECLVACIREESFVCRSVDFSAKEKCMLSRTTAADLWGVLANHAGFAHYERLMEGTRPVLMGCPRNLTRPTDAGQTSAVVSWQEPTMSDREPAVIKGTRSPKSRFYMGTTRVMYTTSDSTGNQLSCEFFVTIKDEEAPVLRDCPQNITKVTSDQEAVSALWVEPTATDNLGSPRLSGDQQPGSWFPPGSTTVTYSAQDEAGNHAECSFAILVRDIPDSNYISLQLVLQNVTYSDALQDNKSVEFQTLASTIEKDFLNIFRDDSTALGIQMEQFSSDKDGEVAAHMKIGFSEAIDRKDQWSKLNAILGSTLVNVAKVKFKQDDGKFQILDACTLSPCPATMNCRAIGLFCTADCTDNAEYCLNGGQCGNDDQNLITCNCHSDNQVVTYSGDRCGFTRVALTGKQLTVMSLGGVWAAVMLGLVAGCIAFWWKRRRTEDKDGASYPLDVFADSPSDVPRGIHLVANANLGYTSQGEDVPSLAENEINPEESRDGGAVDQPEGRRGAHDRADGSYGGTTGPRDSNARTHDSSSIRPHDGSSGPHDGIPSACDGNARPHDANRGPHDGVASPQGSTARPLESRLGFPGSTAPRQSRSSSSSGSRTCSSCTCCKASSCTGASDSRSHSCSSCTCDSGAEVVHFPRARNCSIASDSTDSNSVAKPRQMTVQVDVERCPSGIAHSFDGLIPDPLVESDVPADESVPLIHPRPLKPRLEPLEAIPLLPQDFDGEIPDPIMEFDWPTDNSAFHLKTPLERGNVSDRHSLSSAGVHSYAGTIPDPVSDFDEHGGIQSGAVRYTRSTRDYAQEAPYDDESSAGQLFGTPSICSIEEIDIVITEHFV